MEELACVFCQIAAGATSADIVYQDSTCFAFLDTRPLFPGHVLLCPRDHVVTLCELPAELIQPIFSMTQILAKAVESALDAEGTFVAINNRVSQTVPHLHIHVVPRRRRDGLKGFFWPRHKYIDDSARQAVSDAIAREVRKLVGS
ncbi:MAG: HIT family protein [Acidobacteriaceae bacterium]|nr:HIT family protein [Acidobacteriaceae bacterium]